ncbi:MAG: STN domain-containing protein [Pirellulales bacterium]|nr:STN domain-containing protein [Pirellulales bacterium]
MECRNPVGPRAAALVVGLAAVVAHGASADSPAWLTGKELQRQLRQTVPTVHWQDAPLLEAVTALARANRVALLIDRRVDPGQSLTLSPPPNLPLVEVFHRVAENHGLALGWIGPVIYLGPPEAGPRLETVLELRHDEVRKLPANARRPLMEAAPFHWADFAEPRELVRELARQGNVEVHGLEHIPHDLWRAADLPPLCWIDRVGLIVGQFDLAVAVDGNGRSVSLVPIPRDVAIERSYPGGSEPDQTVRQWRELAPASRFQLSAGKIVVRGPLADHRRIAESIHPSLPAEPSSGGPQQTRFTIREAKGPLRRLLEELAGRLQLELRLEEEALRAAGISLDKQVSLSVADATLEELFEALLKPAGCTFRLEGKILVVFPAQRRAAGGGGGE